MPLDVARAINLTLASVLLAWAGGHTAFAEPARCAQKPRAEFRIFLDVGHTPAQWGATSARGVKEYDFNEQLAGRIEEELTSAGFRSVQVFKTDRRGRPGLLVRADTANDWSADLLLSIHHDSVQPQYLQSWTYDGKELRYSDAFRGFSLFVSRANASYEGSLRLAVSLADQMIARGRPFATYHAEDVDGERHEFVDATRGIYRSDGLAVLRLAKMPAVLLETGVIVNRDEERLLASPEGRETIAKAVTGAVADFCAASAP